MSMLEQEAVEALRAVAIARGPEPGAAERAWAAMEQRLVEGPPAWDLDPSHDAPRPRVPRLVVMVAVAAALLLALGLASWKGGWIAGREQRSDDQAPYAVEPSPAIAPAPEAVTVPAVAPGRAPTTSQAPSPDGSGPLMSPLPAAEPTVAPARVRGETKRRSEPRATPGPAAEPMREPTPPAAGDTLAAELRLLARANAAMRSGQHADALAVLSQHAREFETGQLAPEREYKRALVLCELGRVEQARTVANGFARTFPESPLRAKAEDVCREDAR